MTKIPDFSSIPAYTGPPNEAQIEACLRAVAELGAFRHALPKQVGGFGDDFVALVKSHRRLGEASRDPGLMLAINAHLWGSVFPILLYGSEGQKEKFLPPLLSGDWLAGHAITEPSCGSDVQAMATTAEQTGDGYVLNGEKRYITNVPLADWLVIYAKLDGKISAFLVSREDEGCHFSNDGSLDACRGSATGSVSLKNCRLGADRLLGKIGTGTQMIQKALEYERAFVFAGIAGIMDWQLAEVVRYSRERRSGGVHLGKHQAISHRLADMKLRLDTINLWLGECARLCDAGQRLTLASAQTKLYAAEAFLQSSLDAVQIMGAAGLESGSAMAELVQDAMAGRLFSGSSEVQKNLIAALLGTGDAYRLNPQSHS
ncbi:MULTISPECIES: acyl-CoA dehydrogenase family protein [Methylomonas]|uniref:Isovaleryl-CoA dehydrogenase n=1 Tax=Methylomonas denitrificans TaxID=1538553 RepID=A0A140E6T7_9GAMM|nr:MULTISPECIES: acyl-CoA dehydrogenase family protein [Methylomonas]AMK79111.1 isovaleryl-CoA dehydrogenase [Methylomonas denitrificans]OAH99616.1 isovaleryl-CoA dehydrogenase [Methylomonas methanica]